MKPFAVAGLPPDELNAFLSGAHPDPFRILGPHRMGDALAIRVFRPDARKIDILVDQKSSDVGQASDLPEQATRALHDGAIEAEKIHRDGFFCAEVPSATREVDYRVRVTKWDG